MCYNVPTVGRKQKRGESDMGKNDDTVNDASDIETALTLYNELSDSKKKQFILVLLSLAETEDS